MPTYEKFLTVYVVEKMRGLEGNKKMLGCKDIPRPVMESVEVTYVSHIL
jgi:hypothetical protein